LPVDRLPGGRAGLAPRSRSSFAVAVSSSLRQQPRRAPRAPVTNLVTLPPPPSPSRGQRRAGWPPRARESERASQRARRDRDRARRRERFAGRGQSGVTERQERRIAREERVEAFFGAGRRAGRADGFSETSSSMFAAAGVVSSARPLAGHAVTLARGKVHAGEERVRGCVCKEIPSETPRSRGYREPHGKHGPRYTEAAAYILREQRSARAFCSLFETARAKGRPGGVWRVVNSF